MNKDKILAILERAVDENGDIPMRLVRHAFAVLDKAYAYGNGLEPEGYFVNVEDIQALLSVTPKRKTGKWIVHYECPKCGEITKDFTEYCPFCRADMRGEQE